MITQIVNRCIIIRLLTASVLSLALTLAWLNPCPNAYAQGSTRHYIHRWLALGPFVEGEIASKAIDVDYLLLATGIPESKFATLEGAPKAGDSVSLTPEGYATQIQIWKVLELPENDDVNAMLVKEGNIDYAVAYLITFIESKEATRRELMIGSDDSVKVWLNGKMMHTAAVNRRLTPDEDKVSVDLKAGMNCLMLKVAESMGDWLFTVRFGDESGLQFFDTPDRHILPLAKPLIRLSNPQSKLCHPEPKAFGKPTDMWMGW